MCISLNRIRRHDKLRLLEFPGKAHPVASELRETTLFLVSVASASLARGRRAAAKPVDTQRTHSMSRGPRSEVQPAEQATLT
jgi:hypothetical protein